jgi:hypothetical protein
MTGLPDRAWYQAEIVPRLKSSIRGKEMKNSNSGRGYIGNILAVFGAAVNASAAVETRRMPRAADLVTLGIDPKSFPDVRSGI